MALVPGPSSPGGIHGPLPCYPRLHLNPYHCKPNGGFQMPEWHRAVLWIGLCTSASARGHWWVPLVRRPRCTASTAGLASVYVQRVASGLLPPAAGTPSAHWRPPPAAPASLTETWPASRSTRNAMDEHARRDGYMGTSGVAAWVGRELCTLGQPSSVAVALRFRCGRV